MTWHSFWQKYRLLEVKNDQDLLFQVGKTVNGKVIDEEQYNIIIRDAVNLLQLTKDDIVLDLCCGNGVLTYELSNYASQIIGIDFSQPFIENAIKFKSNTNTKYVCADIMTVGELDISRYGIINKVLIYDALAYFTYSELNILINQIRIIASNDVIILFASVLNKAKIWSFFNTLTRKLRFWIRFKLLNSNRGIGKWWSVEEFDLLAKQNELDCRIYSQNKVLYTSHYRMDVVLQGSLQVGNS